MELKRTITDLTNSTVHHDLNQSYNEQTSIHNLSRNIQQKQQLTIRKFRNTKHKYSNLILLNTSLEKPRRMLSNVQTSHYEKHFGKNAESITPQRKHSRNNRYNRDANPYSDKMNSNLTAEKSADFRKMNINSSLTREGELLTRIDELEDTIISLKITIGAQNDQIEKLQTLLTRSKAINKGIISMLYEHGIMNEKHSIFSLFKDVFFRICIQIIIGRIYKRFKRYI